MLYIAFSLAMLAVAFVVLGFSCLEFSRTRRTMRIIHVHQIAARNAIQKTRMDLLEIGDRAKLLESTVSGGATAVEKLHKAITSTTFGLIDMFVSDNEIRQNVLVVKRTHDQTSQQIYHSVRTTNKALRILADTVIVGRTVKRNRSERDGKKKPPPGNK